MKILLRIAAGLLILFGTLLLLFMGPVIIFTSGHSTGGPVFFEVFAFGLFIFGGGLVLLFKK